MGAYIESIVIGIKILSTMLSFYLENVLREQSSVGVLSVFYRSTQNNTGSPLTYLSHGFFRENVLR